MTELALTLCEQLGWKTATGTDKINVCFTVLEKQDTLGYIQLQKKCKRKSRTTKKIEHSTQTDPQPTVECTLDQLGEIECQLVTDKHEITQWNEYVDRYHYLKYKYPIAGSLKYFIGSDSLPFI